MKTTLVTRIVRDSIFDGPGFRYVVFIKGCNLDCAWCHNPETKSAGQQIMIYDKFCIRCGRCVQASMGLLSKEILPPVISPSTNNKFFPAVEACPTGALEFAAREYSTDWILTDIREFRTMYRETGGGLTISGGEPLVVKDFSFELFEMTKRLGLNTALDTNLSLSWEVVEPFLKVVDLWLCDLKHPSDMRLKAPDVIENLKRLAAHKASIEIRIPVIPGFNDDTATLGRMAEIVNSLGEAIKGVSLLPFHAYGKEKFIALRLPYPFNNANELEPATLDRAYKIFSTHVSADLIHIGKSMVHG